MSLVTQIHPNDSYCFRTETGKLVHRNLVFSKRSRDLHLIVACYKIKKHEHKLPFFERIITQFRMHHITIKYLVLDRGFYRKELLQRLRNGRSIWLSWEENVGRCRKKYRYSCMIKPVDVEHLIYLCVTFVVWVGFI